MIKTTIRNFREEIEYQRNSWNWESVQASALSFEPNNNVRQGRLTTEQYANVMARVSEIMGVFYSYNTPIGFVMEDNTIAVLPYKYSVTTSKHSNILRTMDNSTEWEI